MEESLQNILDDYSWTSLQWPTWEQKKVAVAERLKQELVYGFFVRRDE